MSLAATHAILTTPLNRQSVEGELTHIADWWVKHSVDHVNGGFYGEIDFVAQPLSDANKGVILNSRILWFFSEMALKDDSAQYKTLAIRAFEYLLAHFDDKEHGGAYWEVAFDGRLLQGKKQTYAQCFCIYALCSYFRLTADPLALEKAVSYFNLVEQNARDVKCGGYIEACSEDWSSISDYRLSDKDLNFPKSMNTHLHVLEAYSALYQVHKTAQTEEALRHIIDVFQFHIICHKSAHLKLFFDMQWRDQSQTYSFGHDIEASWLLWESACVLGDKRVMGKLKPIIIDLARACLDEAIGDAGQVCDEFIFSSRKRVSTSYWWVQAEALVGFMNAFALTKDEKYKAACQPIWAFIQQYHIDSVHGEWHWLASQDQDTDSRIYKAGFWKAPYHNGRAMMELQRLLGQS
ncbi:AGE family epimerase/isomerase [Paraglaciecola polaris]|uniref:Cellobiose 2-epimerase n=1 Tax=Paraglaciecola polaris LMG 21857 TaxID=1129793 RepID=K6ZR41_9ALTE|nr:AGE family epimerase/isomerase [Paraglaciecola polaris]GAC31298.1 hypothetical protein GPLA_0379 [Paraglaciecola polaris LMG 21857]